MMLLLSQNFLMGVIPSLIYLVKAVAKSPLIPSDAITGSPFLTSLAVVVLVTLSAGNMAVKVGMPAWVVELMLTKMAEATILMCLGAAVERRDCGSRCQTD